MAWYKPWTWGKGAGGESAVDDQLPSRPPRRQPVSPGTRWPDYPLHYGRRISVADILSAHDSAERGYPRRFLELGRDRLKADGHLRSLVEQRRDGVARKEWKVLPGGAEPVDIAAAVELERQLRRARGFRSALKHHEMAFWHGYALSEIEWARSGNLFVPASFDSPMPTRFVFDEDDQPRLLPRASVVSSPTSALLGDELRAGIWWYTRRDGDRAAVSGASVTGILWSHFKTLSFRDWMKLSARFGIPYVHGTYEAGGGDDDGASEEDIEALKEAVQTLGSDGWAVFSNACQIEIAEAMARGGGAGEIHSAILSVCDAVCSKLIAGATTLNQTSGSTGSYAQSRVHADRGFELLAGDAGDLSDSFSDYVGRMWVHYNASVFPGAQPPRLHLHIVKDSSPTARAGVFDKAGRIGVPLSLAQVRDELQLKPPTGPDDTIEIPGASTAPDESNEEEPDAQAS